MRLQLLYSPASPYARVVRVCVLEWGLQELIENTSVHPFEDDDLLLRANPLGKVPVLVTPQGALVDSTVIIDYLWQCAGFSKDNLSDWQERRRRAWVQGMLDTAVAWRQDHMRPEHQRSAFWQNRFSRALTRTLDAIEAEFEDEPWQQPPAITSIALGCLLGYLDFRHPAFDWRGGHSMLQGWYDQVAQRPSMVQTCPSD